MPERRATYDTFPLPLGPYDGLSTVEVPNDACNVNPNLIAKMPLTTKGAYQVTTPFRRYSVYVAKAESVPAHVTIRLTTDSERYKMEARVMNNRHLMHVFHVGCGHIPDILGNKKNVVLGFDIKTKVQGEYLPHFRAKNFMPWALRALRDYRPNYILADLEPGTDTHQEFMDTYRETKDLGTTMRSNTAHRLITSCGFELIPQIYLFGSDEHEAMYSEIQGVPYFTFSAFYKKK